MMKEKYMKDNRGFSLVELIVVIVIILVLAAVLVPNVSKYIDMAGESNTKNSAATLLSQVQADVAGALGESYLDPTVVFPPSTITLGGVTATNKGYAGYAGATGTYTIKTAPGADSAEFTLGKQKQVNQFTYCDTKHFISWNEEKGWSKIDDDSFAVLENK